MDFLKIGHLCWVTAVSATAFNISHNNYSLAVSTPTTFRKS
jgi:hypothetical protein